MTTLAARAAAAQHAQQRAAAASSEQAKRPTFQVGAAQFDEAPIHAVQVDGMAVLKILKGGSGQLLGLDAAGVLDVSDALPLPPGCLLPLPDRGDDRDRDGYYRRKEDNYDAAANAASSYTAQYLPRLAELNADANVVGFYTTVTNGQVTGPGGALIEVLARYQAGTQDAAAKAKSALPSKIVKAQAKAPGKGVALVLDTTASSAGAISLRAFRLSESYMEVHKTSRFDPSSMTSHQILASNILKEFPVTITRTSLLTAFLSSLAVPTEIGTSKLPAPTYSALAAPSTTSTSPGSLAGPLQSLLTNFETSVNVLGNLRYRDRKQNSKVGQDSQLDAIRALAASEGAANTLNEASGLALVHAFAVKAGAEQ